MGRGMKKARYQRSKAFALRRRGRLGRGNNKILSSYFLLPAVRLPPWNRWGKVKKKTCGEERGMAPLCPERALQFLFTN